jgi:hypothetical protein
MKIDLKFTPGDKVFILHKNSICNLEVKQVEFITTKGYTSIEYKLLLSESKTLMDDDRFIYKREQEVFATISDLTNYLKEEYEKEFEKSKK